MQVVSREVLPKLLRTAGIDPSTRDFPETPCPYRLTITETIAPCFSEGPHRKIHDADGLEDRIPVADRPALGAFLAAAFREAAVIQVLATIPEGTFWLNNKAQAQYLNRVADSRRVSRFLRARGLTDRFRGGFLIRASDFDTVLPILAANTFSGGADVQFTALTPASLRLNAVACHHFDLHFSSPEESALFAVQRLARAHALSAVTLELPDATEWNIEWPSFAGDVTIGAAY